MKKIILTSLLGLLFHGWATHAANAQPTVINVPPDIAPPSLAGGTLNVFDGGTVDDNFIAFDGTINISGGTVGENFFTYSLSRVNITGGAVGNNFTAFGGTINISGGTVDNGIDVFGGSVNFFGGTVGDDFGTFGGRIDVSGGEMRLDGELIGGLETVGNSLLFPIPNGSVLSGTLADGTPFAFSSLDDDVINFITLHATELPNIGPANIYAAVSPSPLGIRQGQTIHVGAGGVVGNHFNAGRGSTVNVLLGGVVGRNLEAVSSTVNISSGSVGSDFDAFHSTVNISGGVMGNGSSINDDSTINISGGEMRLNGALISGLETVDTFQQLDLPEDFVLSGTLTDGTPFAFSSCDGDRIAAGTLILHTTALPSIGPATINATVDPVPLGIRQGQTLNVGAGAVVGNHFNAGLGSRVNVLLHGIVGHNLEAVGSMISISGGTVGDELDAFDGSMVNISGGMVGRNFHAVDNSRVNISGGTVGDDFNAINMSTVNITGGIVGNGFLAFNSSSVNISGGTVGDSFIAFNGSVVDITGGTVGDSFNAFSGTTVNITSGEVGNKFFASNNSVVNISGGTVGDQLLVFDGSTLNITDGFVGERANVSDESVATISGGFVGDLFSVSGDGTVNIIGGRVGNDFDAFGGSTTIISGGFVGHDFDALGGSNVNLIGGTVGFGFDAHNGSTVNISGGAVASGFAAHSGSEVNLYGTEFVLNGVELTGLLLGQTWTITDRDVTLSGLLMDGSPFSFDLNGSDIFGQDFFAAGALLTATLSQPGDLDLDGNVDGSDFLHWQRGFGTHYDTLDLDDWQASFGAAASSGTATSTAVPEPDCFVLLLAAFVCSLRWRRLTVRK